MYIQVTDRCNMRCEHCCMESSPHRKNFMSMAMFEMCLDIAIDFGESITNKFLEKLDFEYDNGFGGQELFGVFGTLIQLGVKEESMMEVNGGRLKSVHQYLNI